ncbi:hypothetical protein MRX96_058094 [Rhipicephalus microplus]
MPAMTRQTAAVLWRTLAIESIKRHYVLSLLEVLIVLPILALLFLSTKFVTQPTTEQGQLRQAAGSTGEDIAGTGQGVRTRRTLTNLTLEYALHLYEDENPGQKGLDIGFRRPREFFYDPEMDRQLWERAYKMQVALNSAFLRRRDKEDVVNVSISSESVG